MLSIRERLWFWQLILLLFCSCQQESVDEDSLPSRPNILFAISDDQSYPYASIYGDCGVSTPAFDWVASHGLLFTNAFCAAPQCSPSRAAILTGKNIWQLEEAGTHSSYFPNKFRVFTDALEESGYTIGGTGKTWGPGNWKDAGWPRNPAGPKFDDMVYDSVPPGIRPLDYQANFAAFLAEKNENKPFFFWYGASEPHRVYDPGIGQRHGIHPDSVLVPPFLPDTPVIRSDIADYLFEIQWFDRHLGKMIDLLRDRNELDNTVIVVTADNGMPFPYAKANVNEFGNHVPLAIYIPHVESPGTTIDDLVSLIDLAPTFLDLAGVSKWEMTGRSLTYLFDADTRSMTDHQRSYVLLGRERHTHARPDNLSYPVRAIRTQAYLFVHNLAPDRWPAGNPAMDVEDDGTDGGKYLAMTDGYHDIDASPSKTWVLDHETEAPYFHELAVGKRTPFQLFDIKEDPFCVKDISRDFNTLRKQEELFMLLDSLLLEQEDPRILGDADVFESYPRFAKMRKFPGFRESGKYNPEYWKD